MKPTWIVMALLLISTVLLAACGTSAQGAPVGNAASENTSAQGESAVNVASEDTSCPDQELYPFVKFTEDRVLRAFETISSAETAFELVGVERMYDLGASDFKRLYLEQKDAVGPECTAGLDKWAEDYFYNKWQSNETMLQNDPITAVEFSNIAEEAFLQMSAQFSLIEDRYMSP